METKILIEEYSKTLGLENSMTLEELIASHSQLRDMKKSYQNKFLELLEEGREIGRARGLQEVLDGDYISIEKLKDMTLAEVMEFINS